MTESHHTIRAVALRTGLSQHVIRIWEKRYEAVKPMRTSTNRRLYSPQQIEKLALLRDAVAAGHSIGQVAKLSVEKLRSLAARDSVTTAVPVREALPQNDGDNFLHDCITAVRNLDSRALDTHLKRAHTALGSQGLLQRVIAPLAQTIGDLWYDGTITAAHEHFASAAIRLFLGHASRPFAASEGAPTVVVATPTGQLHELGALLAASAAVNQGWRVTYLGASLPAAEIAGATRQSGARVVALSLVYPEDDPNLEAELMRLRDLLPDSVKILAGGRASGAYRAVLSRVGVTRLEDLSELCTALDRIRANAKIKGSR